MALSCFEKNVSWGDEQHFGRPTDDVVICRHRRHSSSENSDGLDASPERRGASNKLSSIMYTFLILALFLWYFWYFYCSLASPVVKPQHGSPNVAEPYRPSFEYSSKQDKFRFRLYNRVVWEHALPDAVTFRNRRIVERDACHDASDDENVPATGLVLYRYLRDHPEMMPPHFGDDPTSSSSSSPAAVVRKGRVFYFTCRGKRIWKLRQCPSGQTFVRDACVPITACTEQEDGVLLPTDDRSRYVRCEGGRGIEETCPDDTFFLLDGCRSQADLSYYCQFTDESFFLENFRTRIDCVEGRPAYVRCRDGYKFFDQPDCEPTTCEDRSDGTLVSAGPATVHDQTFTYFSSYATCVGGRLSRGTTVQCPAAWDARDPSNVDHLPQLPTVFDGEKCAVPVFCVNVQPVDADRVVVPVYAWRRHVANWRKASLYDHLEGTACGETTTEDPAATSQRKRVAVSPGDLIHPKRFRITAGERFLTGVGSDCHDDPVKIPVAGSEAAYFDCRTRTERPCPEGQKFNGEECRDPLPHPFRYRDRDVFQLDGLSQDNWIVPWKYVPKGKVPPLQCHGGDFPIRLYSLCSHQDCGRYPFLSQLPSFSVYHPDGYRCYYDRSERRLKKEAATVPPSFDFWTQQQKKKNAGDECVPGQRLQTGHFVWDSVFHATCDPEQPFVFCPSSDTAGILQVGGTRYACRLPDDKRETSVFGPTVVGTEKTEHFELNEIARIHPTQPDQQVRLQTGDPWIQLPAGGMAIHSALDLTVRAPVVLHYRWRVTHPPDVVFHHQEGYKTSPHGGGFVVRRADFTHLPLTIPEYHVEPFVGDIF